MPAGGGDAELRIIDAWATPAETTRVLDWARGPVPSVEPLDDEAVVEHGEQAAWRSAMDPAQRALAAGDVKKVVLSRDLLVHRTQPIDPARVLSALRPGSSTEAAFAFFEGDSTFVGLTPERLVRMDEGRILSEAVAGSSQHDDPRGDALLASTKDLEEHQYVVEHLRTQLARFSSRVEEPIGPGVRRLGLLAHLCTKLWAPREGHESILQIAEALHPTPAVGGVPLEPARQIIERAEGRPRGWYSGALGWLCPDAGGSGEGDLRVALRSALLRGCEARIFVGAGVVPASTVEGEWRETALKAARLLDALGDR